MIISKEHKLVLTRLFLSESQRSQKHLDKCSHFFVVRSCVNSLEKNSVLLRHSLNPKGLIWCLNMAISFVNVLNIVSSAYIHDFVLNACDTFDDKFIF